MRFYLIFDSLILTLHISITLYTPIFPHEQLQHVASKLFARTKVDVKVERVIQILEAREKEYRNRYAVHADLVETEQQKQHRIGYVADEIGYGDEQQRAGGLEKLVAVLGDTFVLCLSVNEALVAAIALATLHDSFYDVDLFDVVDEHQIGDERDEARHRVTHNTECYVDVDVDVAVLVVDGL